VETWVNTLAKAVTTGNSGAVSQGIVLCGAPIGDGANIVENGGRVMTTVKKLTGFTVCIDPGHGGKDPGAVDGVGQGDALYTEEKDINLQVAMKLYRRLIAEGARATLTRASDWYPSLAQRCQIANNFGADIFISIHCNAAVNEKASGVETLFAQGSRNGKRLAELVQQEVVGATKAANRGVVERDDLAVLKGTKMPAVLVELGFITNPQEEAKLNDPAYQDRLVDALVRAIIRYRKGEQA